jgi:hypothetical protein
MNPFAIAARALGTMFSGCLMACYLMASGAAYAQAVTQVRFQTTLGNFVVEVYPSKTPKTVQNFVQYAPIKSGSAYYKRPTSEQAFPVYVENIIVRNIQLVALPKQPDILQLRAEDSKKIVLVLPREGWYFHHRPSLPWDASAVMATGRVTNQHKQRLAADESYLAASLKVPPPKKKTLRSEGASQRLLRERQRDGVTLRMRPRPARV